MRFIVDILGTRVTFDGLLFPRKCKLESRPDERIEVFATVGPPNAFSPSITSDDVIQLNGFDRQTLATSCFRTRMGLQVILGALSEFWGGFHQSTEAPRAPKRRFGAQRPVLTDEWQTSTRTASLKNIKMRPVQICRFFRPLKKSAMADGAPPSLHLNSLGACLF